MTTRPAMTSVPDPAAGPVLDLAAYHWWRAVEDRIRGGHQLEPFSLATGPSVADWIERRPRS